MRIVTLGEGLISLSERELLTSTHLRIGIAGAEANTAVGLSRLGHDSMWLSRVSSDKLGERVLNTLALEGVDVSNVSRHHLSTGLIIKESSNADGTNVTYYRSASASTELELTDAMEEAIRSANLLHVTGITLSIGAKPRAACFKAIEVAKAAGVEVSFDPNFRPQLVDKDEARSIFRRVVDDCDQLLCNEFEAQIITGAKSISLDTIDSFGPRVTIVKRGARGALARIGNDHHVVQPAHAAVAVDSVGAGDGFNAGWIHGYLSNWPHRKALDFGAFAAAQVVQHLGDYEGFPSATMSESWAQDFERS